MDTGGVEGEVAGGVAVAADESVTDHNMAVVDIEAIIIAERVVVLTFGENATAFNVDTAGQHVTCGNVAALIPVRQEAVVCTATIADSGMHQVTSAAIEDESGPLTGTGVGGRGEGDGLGGGADGGQMPLDLQLDATVALEGHPRFDGEGHPSIDGHITG